MLAHRERSTISRCDFVCGRIRRLQNFVHWCLFCIGRWFSQIDITRTSIFIMFARREKSTISQCDFVCGRWCLRTLLVWRDCGICKWVKKKSFFTKFARCMKFYKLTENDKIDKGAKWQNLRKFTLMWIVEQLVRVVLTRLVAWVIMIRGDEY